MKSLYSSDINFEKDKNSSRPRGSRTIRGCYKGSMAGWSIVNCKAKFTNSKCAVLTFQSLSVQGLGKL